jgi:PAS domain S-box-containing protein
MKVHESAELLASRLQAAFEQSPVSTVVYDATGKPIAVNPAFEKLWGASIEDVPPSYSVLSDPQLAAAGVMPAIERAFSGEAVTLPPLRYEMKQSVGRGCVLWTEAHLYAVRGPDGEVEQVVLTHQDVTARHEAEEALARALDRTQRLQTLTSALSRASTAAEVAASVVEQASVALGAASVIVATLTPDGQQLEILDVGEAPRDVIEPWRRFPVTAPVPLAEAAMMRAPIFLENRARWLEQYPAMERDVVMTGHHATMVVPMLVEERTIGVIGAAFTSAQDFDVDRQTLAMTVAQQCAQALDRSRLLDSEREARQEAESANRAKSDFLAIMSHELRTPLNAIGGYAGLMELGVHGPLTEAQQNDLARIQIGQRHLLGLINEVLNYAKLESGSVRYDIESVNVASALAAAETLVAPQAKSKGLVLSLADCPPDLHVCADAEKLQQVLVNLLSNAIKFTDRGTIALSCVGTDRTVQVIVRDTGIGISEEHIAKVFEPFVQVRADLRRTAVGTGLGLAISRDLARGMKGDLCVESRIGVGSAFTLELPRA